MYIKRYIKTPNLCLNPDLCLTLSDLDPDLAFNRTTLTFNSRLTLLILTSTLSFIFHFHPDTDPDFLFGNFIFQAEIDAVKKRLKKIESEIEKSRINYADDERFPENFQNDQDDLDTLRTR